MNQDDLKRQVAASAAAHIEPHLMFDSVIGVGTGSTTNYFIDALAGIKHTFDGAVASSIASRERLEQHGIPVYELNDVSDMAFYVDGADEANDALQLIKGGGGALTREKIVASVAKQFICIVDESKVVKRLGRFPLPIEVVPMARSAVAREMVRLGGRPVWRQDFTTDNGNVILDIHHLDIVDPPSLEAEINNIPGVVTNGLFAIRPADMLMIGTADGIDLRHG